MSWVTPTLSSIGTFLHGNGLAATPMNYRVVYRYLIDREPSVARAIELHLARHGMLDERALTELGHEEDAQVKSEIVGQLAAHIRRQLAAATTLIGRSNDDVRSFGKALDVAVDSIGGATDPEELTRNLVKITRAMITKSKRVESRLTAMSQQIESLRRDLDSARRDAALDPLTGLLNRRAFLQKLETALAAAEVNHTMICLAFCDIDHFKRINDAHGHQVGDRVIKFIADCMAEKCRSDMTLARYGGEEFVILFEHATIESAGEIVDAIRRDVARRNLVDRVDGNRIGSVSFSAGLTQFVSGNDAATLIGCADRALYRAKALGRNRVEIYLRGPEAAR